MSQHSTGLSDGERKRGPYKKRTIEGAAFPSSDPESLMDTVMLARHFGRQSKMAITRLRRHVDPETRLPPPDLYISQVPFWRRRTIDAYLAKQEARSVEKIKLRKEHADKAIAGRQAKRAETAVKPAAHASEPAGVGGDYPPGHSALSGLRRR